MRRLTMAVLLVWSTGGGGGAKVEKPIAVTLIGARCSSDGKGSIAAFFGPSMPGQAEKLGFNIGPIHFDSVPGVTLPHVSSSAPYHGPGRYTGAPIAGWLVPHDYKTYINDRGVVTVNADRQTGTFATDDGKAAGTWDCGLPLQ